MVGGRSGWRGHRGVKTQGWKSRELVDGPELGSWGSSGGDKVGVPEGRRGMETEAPLDPGSLQCWETQQEKERQDALLVLAVLSETGKKVGSSCLFSDPCPMSGPGRGVSLFVDSSSSQLTLQGGHGRP